MWLEQRVGALPTVGETLDAIDREVRRAPRRRGNHGQPPLRQMLTAAAIAAGLVALWLALQSAGA